MIILDEDLLQSKEDIEKIKLILKKHFNHSNKKDPELYSVFEKFFDECYEGDLKLQKLVSTKISRDLTSFLIISSEDHTNYNEFNFVLASKDGRSIKKKEEKLFQKFAHECFKDIQPIEARLIAFEERKQKAYI